MIDGLKPYPAYKDVDLPWLQKVPAHWSFVRAKALLRPIDVRSTTGDEELLTVSSERGVIPRRSTTVTMFKAESYVGHKLCWPGDLVVNSLWAWGRGLGVSRHHGIVSTAYGVYRPCAEVAGSSEWLHELVRSAAFQWELQVRSKGVWISRLQVTDEAFLRAPIPLPPPDERASIVRFIGHTDRLIRRYIIAKQKLIKLLEDERLATTRRAMREGVDLDVRLVPSGVGWIGDVPEHWSIKRLKWVTRLQRGYDLPADRRTPGDFPVVSSGGVIDTHVQARATGPGVVMGRYGSTDAVFYIESDFWPHNTALFVTSFQGNRPRWVYHMLRTISKADHAGKSAVPGVDRKDLFDIRVAVPPIGEQAAIVEWIERATASADQAIRAAQREISLLREFRSRLISDVVTGKLDVREAAANLPDPVDDASGDSADEADGMMDDDDDLDAAGDEATE